MSGSQPQGLFTIYILLLKQDDFQMGCENKVEFLFFWTFAQKIESLHGAKQMRQAYATYTLVTQRYRGLDQGDTLY